MPHVKLGNKLCIMEVPVGVPLSYHLVPGRDHFLFNMILLSHQYFGRTRS